MRLTAGMEKTHLVLHPGEEIRTPRILLLAWKGDRLAAHNRFRRLMLFDYAPQQKGRPLRMPVALQCFDRYVGKARLGDRGRSARCRPDGRPGRLRHPLARRSLVRGRISQRRGQLVLHPSASPGASSLSATHAIAAGFSSSSGSSPSAWPPAAQIAREHPEFVFGGDKGGLFKLSDPAARAG